MDLTGLKVMVTGAAGLIGSHIVDELVREGAEVRAFDSLVRGRVEHLRWAQEHGVVEFIEGDIRDKDALLRAMKDVDFVFHEAAAWLRLCQSNPRLSLDVNICGTFNVLESCVESGVKKIIAASSSSVYGEGVYLPTDEKHPFNNNLFYGASKIANEQHYISFQKKYGLKFIALRYLNVYGPRQPYDAAYMDVIMHFLNKIDCNEPPVIDGDGNATIDLVYVEDVAKANIMALKTDLSGEFFNVASGKETSIKELALLLIRLKGKEGKLHPLFQQRDSNLVVRRCGDPVKAKEKLNFTVSTSVEEGMRRVISWREGLKLQKTVC
jgi:UDP-glucose 4-epimerase